MSTTKQLRILSLPVDRGGCGYYRVRQPFEMLTRHTDHEAHVVDLEKLNKAEYLRGVVMAVDLADVVVFRATGDTENSAVEMIRKQPEFKTKKIVLDIDDNPELVSPYSAHYADFGIEEIYDNIRGAWLWKDGEERFDLVKNRLKIEKMVKDMKGVDMITVTTKRLQKYAQQYNKNVAVLPNCIDTSKWWELPLEKTGNLRIALQGGYSHYEDWEMIKEPLNKLLREHRFTLLMIGYDFSGIIDEDLRYLVEAHDWVDFTAHSYRMMCLNIDIGIVPLEGLDRSPFNQYKSSIKFYEFSAMGVPTLVSNVPPYDEDINTDISMPFTDEKSFYKGLETLILSGRIRSELGDNAKKWVKENRDAKSSAHLWSDAYSSLLT